MSAQEIVLAARPEGKPKLSTFRRQDSRVKELATNEVRLRSLYYSVDPYMRGRMNAGESYIHPFEIDRPLEGGAIAEVVESKAPDFKKGDLVVGMLPWATEFATPAQSLEKIESHRDHASLYLGLLGMPGLTAYFGLLEVGKPKAGETVVVSGAAGAVGSAVGQLAKLKGCRVVGIAGSDEKLKILKEKFGFDEVINYKKTPKMEDALKEACPAGVDVYFDNVGGEISDAVLNRMNLHGRVSICGQISVYNSTEIPTGPLPQIAILTKRLTVRGFIIFDYADRYADARRELSKWYDEGKLKSEETITQGFENLPNALLGLFDGANTGKAIVRVERRAGHDF